MDLVDVEARHAYAKGAKLQLESAAYAAYLSMVESARADGIKFPLLTIVSAYRSEERQARLFAAAVLKYGSPEAARKWVAPPGSSVHGTGRALDLWLGSANSSANVAALRETAAWKWLVENAAGHGFGPYKAEPWHWEFASTRAP